MMRVFVAGATGAIGARLVPELVQRGHEVTGTSRSPEKTERLRAQGAEPVVLDLLDARAVREAVAAARPEAIVHQASALAGLSDFKHFRPQLRADEPTPHRGHGRAARGRAGDGRPPLPGAELRRLALRARRRAGQDSRFPIVGDGGGIWSFVHLDDATAATVLALGRGAPGTYNIVDDEPAPVREWLPALAAAVGAKPPRRIPRWLARLVAGEAGVALMTEIRGASNAKAKRELGWTPRYPSWRQGFVDAYSRR